MRHEDPSAEAAPDVAGQSARRELERRRLNRREERLAARGCLVRTGAAFVPEPQSTRAWEQGAKGEEAVGARLDRLREQGLGVLHDRRIQRRGNIDHLVVTPTAVWVIDSKRYKGRPALRVEGGLLRPRTELLVVNGRNRTNLVDGVQRQVDAVCEVVGPPSVRGVLCFVGADWPLLGGSFAVTGVHVVRPRKLSKRFVLPQSGAVDIDATMTALDQRFRPA